MSCLFTNYNLDEVASLIGDLELPPDDWMRSAIVTDNSGNLYLPFKDYSEEDDLKIYRYKNNTSSITYVSFCFNENNILAEMRGEGLGSVYLNMCSPRSMYEGCKDSKGIVINPSSPDPGGSISTASVHIVVQNGGSATMHNIVVVSGDSPDRYFIASDEVPLDTEQEENVVFPLIDGHYNLKIEPAEGSEIIVSGNATYYPLDNIVRITGDCEIVIRTAK